MIMKEHTHFREDGTEYTHVHHNGDGVAESHVHHHNHGGTGHVHRHVHSAEEKKKVMNRLSGCKASWNERYSLDRAYW